MKVYIRKNMSYYIVQTGVNIIKIVAYGAGGGGCINDGTSIGNGGQGGSVNANFNVQPGDLINWYIGKGGDFGASFFDFVSGLK